jgi:murein DD-endopeptidase MepM/ murein hydrolase activator NlpD
MLVPVKGVLTSKFGMRFHPIKKTERLHAGVDWAAPTGTPIRAAFSGKVGYRDVRGGYGNFIELIHKDGITSRYAHMHEFGDGIELGSVVQAGDLIGYVGTTGLSTGPHLHFEIRHRGEPTDPLAFEMETGTDAPQTVSSPALKGYRDFVQTVLTAQ